MSSKKQALNASRLYLILDRAACGGKNMKSVLREAVKGGVDIVQLRDKLSSTKEMTAAGRPLLALCRRHGIPFIVCDRLDVCLALDADGLHIGQDDMTPELARSVLGPGEIIGLSCHNASDVQAANREKIDYIGFGPLFKTATKPHLAPIGAAALKKALAISEYPVFAIGGITLNTWDLLPKTSRLRVAVCREICQAREISKQTKKLKHALNTCCNN